MYKVVITELANNDLEGIVSYILEELISPVAATNLLKEIEKAYEHLSTNPLIYEVCRDARLAKDGYHRVVIKNYVLIFKIDEKSKAVNILRFFYGAMDYINLIWV